MRWRFGTAGSKSRIGNPSRWFRDAKTLIASTSSEASFNLEDTQLRQFRDQRWNNVPDHVVKAEVESLGPALLPLSSVYRQSSSCAEIGD